MFIYQDNSKDICITFTGNLPVNPKYIISYDSAAEEITINGQTIEPAEVLSIATDTIYQTAQTINKTTILSLDNSTISIPEDTVGDGVFKVTEGGTLIITGNGTINGVGKNKYNMALWATNKGKIIINGGKFTNIDAQDSEEDASHFDLIYVSKDGYVEINDGFFHCATPRWTLNRKNADNGTILVKGGTFVNYNPAESYTDEKANGEPSNFVAEGYIVVAKNQPNGDIWYTVVKG